MSKNKRPAWKTDQTLNVAIAIHELATAHREAIETRTGAGILDGLLADVVALRTTADSAVSSRVARKAATLDQVTALRTGATVVAAVRTAIRDVYLDQKSIQREFGVGHYVATRNVRSVAAALGIVLDAATAHPAECRAAGIVDDDLRRAREALEALSTADEIQERKKMTACQATARRRATQLRVEATIRRVHAAAVVAFCDQPELVARFDACLRSRNGGSSLPAVPAAGGARTPAAPSPAAPVA